VDDLHQRRLSRAVLAAERMDRARSDVERDTLQRNDSGKPLDDVAHRQQGSGHDARPASAAGSLIRETPGRTMRLRLSTAPSPVSASTTCSMPYTWVTSESSSTCPDSTNA